MIIDRERARALREQRRAQQAKQSEGPSALQRGVNALPDIGGAVGGFMGINPAMRSANAARFGVAGRAISHDINALTGQEESWTPQQAMTELGKEGAKQAALNAGGEGITAIGRGLGRVAMRSALIGRGVESGKAAAEMIRARIPVGGIKPETLERIPVVGKALSKSTLAAGAGRAADNFQNRLAGRNAVNAAATQAGVRIPRKVAEDAIKQLNHKISVEMGDVAESKFLNKKLAEWRARKLDFLTPEEVQPIITRFDARSAPIFKAMNRGENIPSAAMQARASYMREVAEALRGAMRKSVPGHEAESALLGNAIAARKAESAAAAVPGVARFLGRGTLGAGIGGAVGAASDPDRRRGAAEGAAVGGMLANSPQVLSRIALGVSDPALLAILRRTPQAFSAATRDNTKR